MTGATDPIDAAEALDDTNGIPVNVVVDEVITVLEVLPFADAVGRDEQVDFARLRQGGNLRAVFGSRGEIGEDLVVGAVTQSGAGITATADQRHVDTKLLGAPFEERIVEVTSGVRERGENEDFLVRLAELVGGGLGDFGGNELLELRELGVGFGSDILRGFEEDSNLVLVLLEIIQPVLPVIQLQVVEAVFEFAADEHSFFDLLVVSRIVEFDFHFLGLQVPIRNRQVILNLRFQSFDLGDGPLHRDFKRLYGTFEAFEKIYLHHADEEFFAIGLCERITGRRLVN